MKKALTLALFLLLGTLSTFAQATMTGTIVDANANAYFPGTISATLYGSNGLPYSGATPSVNPSTGPFATTAGGNFSITVTPNASITPSGTQWLFTICAQSVPAYQPPPASGAPTSSTVCSQTLPLTITVSGSITANFTSISLLGPSGVGGGSFASLTAGSNASTSPFATAGPWTFSVNGAASVPGVSITGTPFAGTGTTSTPQLYMNCNGSTAPSSWGTSGTTFGANFCSGYVGNFMDVHANGGASVFKINSAGAMTASSLTLPSGSVLNLNGGFQFGASSHLLFSPTAPVIGTCGTSPSIVANNGTAAFTVNVGTGGTATTCTVTMPAATTGWGCMVSPNGAPQAAAETFSAPTSTTLITISNYTASTGAALAFASGAVFNVNCAAY
jgi:hypothetical protein